MNEVIPIAAKVPLASEWARVELLGQCALQLRQGEVPTPESLSRLRQLQSEVFEKRGPGSPWSRLPVTHLSPIEQDLLACAVAPEVEPRVGFLFQQLQPGVSQPYPSAALIQELLGMLPADAIGLRAALAEDSPLRRLRLVETDEAGLYAPIRPAWGVTATLLGASAAIADGPPGATRIPAHTSWDELVVPDDCIARLREFLSWVEHRKTVVDKWGGRSVGGPIALFAGASGTGKTLAASVLATAMGFSLYRVDLGALVSKYIGETEKNLNRLFAAAHGQPIVLQFDEADSLFGKRAEVTDARDRYANLEVSHLLGRIEQHEGPCILTTNLRGHMDAAFWRRFHVVIEFPRPDAGARAKLWRLHLPPRAPLACRLDFDFLGASVNLTGGRIRNAALHAAYLAAMGRGAIGMEEIALAVLRELGKDGRPFSSVELGALAPFLKDRPC